MPKIFEGIKEGIGFLLQELDILGEKELASLKKEAYRHFKQ